MAKSSDKPYSIQLADITYELFINCNEKEVRFVSKHGVSIAESRCLRILSENDELTVTELANQMDLTSGRITRIIDGLVHKNLVTRETGQNDRRIYKLSLTPKGKKTANSLLKGHKKIHEKILNNIPDEYHPQMIRSLELLNEAVKKWLNEEG